MKLPGWSAKVVERACLSFAEGGAQAAMGEVAHGWVALLLQDSRQEWAEPVGSRGALGCWVRERSCDDDPAPGVGTRQVQECG